MGKWLAEHGRRLAADPSYCDPMIAGWWVWGISLWLGGPNGFLSTDGSVSDRAPKMAADLSGGGVSAQVTGLRGKGPVAHIAIIERHLRDLQDRLHSVIVLNRDWTAGVTNGALSTYPTAPGYTRAVLLDPPYLQDYKTYESDDGNVARGAYQWAIRNGEKYRIAYCCLRGTFEVPAGWMAETKTFRRTGRNDDMVMFSPACKKVQMDLFAGE